MGHLARPIVAVLLAAACSAAGPAAAPPSPPAAFTVTATVPAAGATDVALGASVTITFSAPLWNQGLGTDSRHPCTNFGGANASITIAPVPVAAGACSIGPSGDTVVLGGIPSGAVWLRGATTYTVTVAPQVSSRTGVALGAAFTLTFRTRSGQQTSLPLVLIPWSVGYAPSPGSTLGAGISPYVGDCENAAAPLPCSGAAGPFPHRVRAFAAFDLAPALLSIPGIAIQSAVLVVTLVAVSTPSDFFAPAAGGGPIMVERVDYLDNGRLDQDDYSMAAVGAPVVAIGGYALGTHSVTITGIVQGALTNPPPPSSGWQYLGLRFYWATMAAGVENTDRNGDNDIATLGRTLTLTVYYGN